MGVEGEGLACSNLKYMYDLILMLRVIINMSAIIPQIIVTSVKNSYITWHIHVLSCTSQVACRSSQYHFFPEILKQITRITEIHVRLLKPSFQWGPLDGGLACAILQYLLVGILIQIQIYPADLSGRFSHFRNKF